MTVRIVKRKARELDTSRHVAYKRDMSNVLQAHRELVGRQIRKARKHAGLSHDALAARAGTSRQHLIKLEKGQHLPSDRMLSAIAAATGKTEAFFDSDEDDEESDPVADLMTALRLVVRAELAKGFA